jgi:selenocysteine lyase/cysteine desulfurase
MCETGTQNHEGWRRGRAVDFRLTTPGDTAPSLNSAFSKLHERGDEFVRQLWDGLSEIEGVSLFGPSPGEPRTPTIAFTVAGVSSTDVAKRLADSAIFVSNGDFYASTVVERLGLAGEGLVRAGCACYTTGEEIGRLIDGVRWIVQG